MPQKAGHSGGNYTQWVQQPVKRCIEYDHISSQALKDAQFTIKRFRENSSGEQVSVYINDIESGGSLLSVWRSLEVRFKLVELHKQRI